MMQTEHTPSSAGRQRVAGPVAIIAVATVAAMLLVAVSWHATSKRVTAIEDRLDRLTDTLEQRLPAGDWKAEIDGAAKRLMEREAERWRREMSRLMADVNARVKALTPTPPAAAFPEERPGINKVGDLASGAPAAAESTVKPADGGVGEADREREPDFDFVLQSEYRMLGLTPDRLEEVGPWLEAVIDSLWPEYIAFLDSGSPDLGSLRRRYCTEVESFLTDEEVMRLGCGSSASMVQEQPGTTSEPPSEGGDEAHRLGTLPPAR